MLNERMLLKELSEIKSRGGVVSIFWITSHQARAKRIQWLEDNGVIVPVRSDKRYAFPNCVFDVHEERLTMRAADGLTVTALDNLSERVHGIAGKIASRTRRR